MDTKDTILIVDNDPQFRKTLSDILRPKGYAPLATAKGKTALDRVKEERPAVAIIDLKLPDMDGLEVMEKIKKRSPGTECIVLTGYASQESAIEAVNLGAYGYMQKPYDVEQLVVTIRRAVEKREAEKALRESEERYRAIFEQAADSIVLVDAETGALVEFNDRAHENLGYTREEFEKLKIPDFEVIESAEEVAKHIEKIINEGADTFETKHRTKGEEIRDIQVSSRAISIHGRDFALSIWRDITERKRAEETIEAAALETVEAVSSIVEATDPYTSGHSAMVTEIAIKIAQEMGLQDGQLDTLRIAGPLHDVGKVGIPSSVLNKPTVLTEAEWVMIRAHPQVSANVAQQITAFQAAVPVIRHHHERWDGTGYPDGLKGAEIPLLARILAVADGFQAMISERPYRRARTEEEALAELEKGAGSQWDPEVVNAFLKLRKPPTKQKDERKRRR